MIRTRISDDGSASTSEFVDVENYRAVRVQVGVMPDSEHALALCVVDLAKHGAIDVHVFVASLAQELGRR